MTTHATHDRLDSLEYHVHGRGWWLRLAAWVGMAAFVIGGFVIQGGNIDNDNRLARTERATQRATCIGIVRTQSLLIKSERLEIQEQTIDDFTRTPLQATLNNRVDLRGVIVLMQQARRTLLASSLCVGVTLRD